MGKNTNEGDDGEGGWLKAISGLFDAFASLPKVVVLAALVCKSAQIPEPEQM